MVIIFLGHKQWDSYDPNIDLTIK